MLAEVDESVPLPSFPNEAAPRPLGGVWRLYQSRYLISHGASRAEDRAIIEQVAKQTGLCADTVRKLRNCEYPVPSHTAFAIAHAQQNFTFLRLLAERVRLTIRESPLTHPPVKGNFLMKLAHEHYDFFALWDKVAEGVPLTDEESVIFDQQAEQIAKEVLAGRDQSHALREQARNKLA